MPTEQPPAILYVEDEFLTSELVETTLREAGFDVVAAETGDQALALLDEGATPFLALITDINLGTGADGWDVGRRARELFAALPVVYVSGAAEHEWASKGVPNSVMIGKPFAPVQVVVAVSSLINAAPTPPSP